MKVQQEHNGTIEEISRLLSELTQDIRLPKNVKIKINGTISVLKEEKDTSIRIHKALNELGEIADDANIQPYTRTQIWNVVSILEKL